MNDNYSLGTALRTVRKERNMSQEEVALIAEITTTYYGMVERDEKSPTVRMLERICKALDYPISELFSANVTKNGADDSYAYQLENLLRDRTESEKEQIIQIVKKILCLADRGK